MTQSPSLPFQQAPAFQGLSSEGLQLLQSNAELLRYDLGQLVVLPSSLPAKVSFILEGTARLLGTDQGKLATLARLGPGELLGLASLLHGNPCEHITASSALVVASLDDRFVLELFQTEPAFREWCQSHIWPSEVAQLIQAVQSHAAGSDGSVMRVLSDAYATATLVQPHEEALLEAQRQGRQVFLVSAPASQQPWPIETFSELPDLSQTTKPFGYRLLSLPITILEAARANPAASEPSGDPSQAPPEPAIGQAPAVPEVSGLNSIGSDQWKQQLVRAEGPVEETLACFQMLCKQLDLPFRRDAIEKGLRQTLQRGSQPTLQLCGELGASFGLHVMGAKVPASVGSRLQVPSLVEWKDSFALVMASSREGIILASPRDGIVELSPQEIEHSYPDGIGVLQFDRSNVNQEKKFGPSWFWPALKRYRGILVQVLIASFVVQMFTLANPLLIQVIIDKVISQRSFDTLQILGVALVVVTILEGVLSSLRTFLFAQTTNRIDQRLGAEVIDHLLRLPLSYFDKRPVGELSTRVAELEKIRNFLTGQALTTVLDSAFSVIYIVVMLVYSIELSVVALAVVPIQIALTLLGAPLFRRQYREAAIQNANTQSHLVEVMSGIQTVKAQNVEMVSRFKWQDFYSRYIQRTFEKTVTGTALNETSSVLQKLSQLLVLWVGAILVLRGDLTLGQLIAFRIISGNVTQPLLRLSSTWQSIQEIRISFERLADVIDTKQESDSTDQSKIPLPPITGEVEFQNVTFAFVKGKMPVLKDVDLHVPSGTFVGIVGQSGSGKSTLMKLLPRLYSPDSGRILIDHYDISKIELYSLRRQIGIVPQEPILFSGSVSENIALTRPDADSEEIVRAARLACAHDFIMDLPDGYSSSVGERGSALSGGQRQRLAIARTLLSEPKLLVMDEATSALDYATERQVCDNLIDSLHDRTVFFITHRLSTIKRADLIIMMHQGAIVEMGTHAELMEKRGRYFALSRQQEAQ
ncbi:peptidase domain-containing ABC transporter [Synechococcus sp. HK05]|uniref:ABC transporter transmembrane domain-containing protein n=1 Tax=Synechococcus sp. HK05 TaxID=2725975 RepID=UPI001C3843D6|nr:peptidase domain-containing ABC transporter [Synechococcus sp. HK05]MBV2352144.1 peptidase domain-containing ABC transporter [Synechococcus sp. HK05]